MSIAHRVPAGEESERPDREQGAGELEVRVQGVGHRDLAFAGIFALRDEHAADNCGEEQYADELERLACSP